MLPSVELLWNMGFAKTKNPTQGGIQRPEFNYPNVACEEMSVFSSLEIGQFCSAFFTAS